MDNMNLLRALDKFDNIYMYGNRTLDKIIEILPKSNGVSLPCSVYELFKSKNLNFDNNVISDIDELITSENDDCIVINIDDNWYSLELKNIDDENYCLHLINLNLILEKLNLEITNSQLDSLTKIFQRNAIETYVNSVIEKNPDKECTLFMLDVDYFKNINDNYGHLFGDKVLSAIAKVLKRIVANNGNVGRLGGDEFCLFVEHDLNLNDIKNISKQIKNSLSRLIIDVKKINCTATIGISQYPSDGDSFESLYIACDKALYKGKKSGRDCYVITNDYKN